MILPIKDLVWSAIWSIVALCGMFWIADFALASGTGVPDPAGSATWLALIMLPASIISMALIIVGFLALLGHRPKFRFDSVFTTDVDGVITVNGRRGQRTRKFIELDLNGVGFVEADVDFNNGDDFLVLWADSPVGLEGEEREALRLREVDLSWMDQPMVAAALTEAFAVYVEAGQVTGSVEWLPYGDQAAAENSTPA